MLSFRNDEERREKLAGMAGKFLVGRQKALERYSAEAGDNDGRLAAFYELKLKVRSRACWEEGADRASRRMKDCCRSTRARRTPARSSR